MPANKMPLSKAEIDSHLGQLGTMFQCSRDLDAAASHWLYLIGRKLGAQPCAEAVALCEQAGWNVVSLDLLSQDAKHWSAAVKLGIQGSPGEGFQAQLRELGDTHLLDCVFQAASLAESQVEFACFDMDSTLIKAEVIDELAKLAGVGEQVALITERAMQGELDFNQSFKARMALLEGLSESVLENVASNLVMMDGAEVLLRNLRNQGIKTAIFSGGFNYFAKFLQGRFGFDHVFANHLDIKDGALTGHVREPIINAQAKSDLLVELSGQYDIALDKCLAVGDGANDLLMLAQAGYGVAFRAKPIVQQQAKFAITYNGLEAILFLLGLRESDLI